MNKPTLKLDWCSHEAAKYACEKWHYSGTVPPGLCRPAYVGVWESGKFIGVVIFGRPGVSTLGSQYGLTQYQCCELQRVALAKHQSPVSRIVRVAILLVAKRNPGVRLIVSFADPHHGHHGGIYQAGGWTYTGETSPSQVHYDRSGKAWHDRCVGKKLPGSRGLGRKRPKEGMVRSVQLPGKHRYLMPLDPEMRRRILPLAKPYPKRATSVDSDTSANHAGEGGASPTVALSEAT